MMLSGFSGPHAICNGFGKAANTQYLNLAQLDTLITPNEEFLDASKF
jgi:hypothetical protein